VCVYYHIRKVCVYVLPYKEGVCVYYHIRKVFVCVLPYKEGGCVCVLPYKDGVCVYYHIRKVCVYYHIRKVCDICIYIPQLITSEGRYHARQSISTQFHNPQRFRHEE